MRAGAQGKGTTVHEDDEIGETRSQFPRAKENPSQKKTSMPESELKAQKGQRMAQSGEHLG
jgi:hypothetical protein